MAANWGPKRAFFMVPAAIATFVYVLWFLRGKDDDPGKTVER
jgi:hypothetical protein